MNKNFYFLFCFMGSMMSWSTLANIESGRKNIKASDLKGLQILFDVEYSEFFKD